MGWFWGPSGNGNTKSTTNDPLRNLDPSLRDFLEKESPVRYKTSGSTTPVPPPPAPEKQQSYKDQILPPSEPQSSSASQTNSSTPKVPAESLFPDGRYAHLWKNYKSLYEVENASKTDQEKLVDVLEGYKFRKAEIGRAALENCALEQWAVNDCFRNGGWSSRMSMCRAENRQLERCYLMQAKFLKALGYLATFDRPPEVDEKIQMHADTLYHRMLDQEKAIEEAKATGQPAPTFPPIIPSSSTPSTTSPSPRPSTSPRDDRIRSDQLTPEVQAQLKRRLEGLNPEEREVEEKAIVAEIAAGERLGRRIGVIYEEQAKTRKERKERGQETLGDKFSEWLGW
ncbi:MAG: hypothetical protein M1830_002170 [Pleopsidium flavum]|nr:MAG: hypothetical protein M1830_002170 [Pleopsidium flavum]